MLLREVKWRDEIYLGVRIAAYYFRNPQTLEVWCLYKVVSPELVAHSELYEFYRHINGTTSWEKMPCDAITAASILSQLEPMTNEEKNTWMDSIDEVV